MAFGPSVIRTFPQCEEFWRRFVVPVTERFSGYPIALLPDRANLRKAVDERLVRLAEIHYSIFMNLAFAHEHFKHETHCRVEDFYTHLATVCDLTESFLESTYFILLECRDGLCKFTACMTEIEFIEVATRWYRESYPAFHEHYVKKGRRPPFPFRVANYVAHEFVSTFLRKPKAWKAFATHAGRIRPLRNRLVHNTLLGRVVVDGVTYMPKAEVISKYPSWSQAHRAARDEDLRTRDFARVPDQLAIDLEKLEQALDVIWKPVIDAFSEEFFSSSRTALRTLYHLTLRPDDQTSKSSNAPIPSAPDFTPTASGVRHVSSSQLGPTTPKSPQPGSTGDDSS